LHKYAKAKKDRDLGKVLYETCTQLGMGLLLIDRKQRAFKIGADMANVSPGLVKEKEQEAAAAEQQYASTLLDKIRQDCAHGFEDCDEEETESDEDADAEVIEPSPVDLLPMPPVDEITKMLEELSQES
jgi:hypothetical protein